MRYICKHCGKSFAADCKPKFCPFCAEAALTSEDARTTALSKAQEVKALVPRLEQAWEKYGRLHAEYERLMAGLNQYKKRGHIDADEIPKPELCLLTDFLRELREAETPAPPPPEPVKKQRKKKHEQSL